MHAFCNELLFHMEIKVWCFINGFKVFAPVLDQTNVLLFACKQTKLLLLIKFSA